jgi:hypothetical protein
MCYDYPKAMDVKQRKFDFKFLEYNIANGKYRIVMNDGSILPSLPRVGIKQEEKAIASGFTYKKINDELELWSKEFNIFLEEELPVYIKDRTKYIYWGMRKCTNPNYETLKQSLALYQKVFKEEQVAE